MELELFITAESKDELTRKMYELVHRCYDPDSRFVVDLREYEPSREFPHWVAEVSIKPHKWLWV